MHEQVLSQAEIDELHKALEVNLSDSIFNDEADSLARIRPYLQPMAKAYRHADGRLFIHASDIIDGYVEVGHMILCTDTA